LGDGSFVPGDDDGAIDLDFGDLNLLEMMAGHTHSGTGGDDDGGTEGGGAGVGGAMREADFSAIDGDLMRFAQDPVIKEALSSGVDLRLYAKSVDAELRGMEMASIADYVREADAIAVLFDQISHCEGVLSQMQSMLSGFQSSLSGISAEIHTLQEQSFSLSVQMANRKALVDKLRAFEERVSVPPALIQRITEGSVDEAWLVDLAALSDKLSYSAGAAAAAAAGGGGGGSSEDPLADLHVNPWDTPIGREALPAVERLREAAVYKLSGWFQSAVRELTKPNSNMAKVQEYVLLKFSKAMAFLSEHGRDVGRQVRQLYITEVGKLYADIFRRYHGELSRLLLPGAGKGDTLCEYAPADKLKAAIAVRAGGHVGRCNCLLTRLRAGATL